MIVINLIIDLEFRQREDLITIYSQLYVISQKSELLMILQLLVKSTQRIY